MKRRTLLSLLGTASVGGSLLLGSGAVTTQEAPRQVGASVVGDGDAYLTIEFEDAVSVDCEADDIEVTIRNRTPQPLERLTVDFSTGAGMVDDLSARLGEADGTATFETDETTLTLASGTVPVGKYVTATVTVAGFSGTDTTALSFGVDAGGGSVSVRTESDRTITLDYDCPQAPLSLACPFEGAVGASVTAEAATPVRDRLAFDDDTLPDKGDIGFSTSRAAIRDELNGISGIDLGTDEVLGPGLEADDIEAMPDDPWSLDLGGAARIGETDGDDVASIPGGVTLTDGAAVVGDVDTGRTLELTDSAIAGDVTAEGVGELADAVIVGDLTENGADGAFRIENSAVCGTVDAGVPIPRIDSSEVGGSVTASGDIGGAGGDDTGVRNADIGGDVTTTDGGDIRIAPESTVAGDVDADGAVPSVKDAVIGGSVSAVGDIGTAADDAGIERSDVGGSVATTDGGDVRITDSTVARRINADGAVPMIKNATVGRSVTASGDIGGQGGDDGVTNADIGGDVTTTDGGDIRIESGTTVQGDVDADGSIPVLRDVDIVGTVRTDGPIGVGDDDGTIRGVVICGSVDAGGRIRTLRDSRVNGSVTAAGDIGSGDDNNGNGNGNDDGAIRNTTVGGDVAATDGGDIRVRDSAVGGDVEADRDVLVRKNSTVEGSVEAAGNVVVRNSTVEGSVEAAGNVVVRNSTVEGSVEVGGSLTLKNATIGGELRIPSNNVRCRGNNEIGSDAETCSGYFSDDDNGGGDDDDNGGGDDDDNGGGDDDDNGGGDDDDNGGGDDDGEAEGA